PIRRPRLTHTVSSFSSTRIPGPICPLPNSMRVRALVVRKARASSPSISRIASSITSRQVWGSSIAALPGDRDGAEPHRHAGHARDRSRHWPHLTRGFRPHGVAALPERGERRDAHPPAQVSPRLSLHDLAPRAAGNAHLALRADLHRGVA